jgi:hypothetical protein
MDDAKVREVLAGLEAALAQMAKGGAIAGPPEWSPDKQQMRQVSEMPDGSVWLTVVTRLKGCGRSQCKWCGGSP